MSHERGNNLSGVGTGGHTRTALDWHRRGPAAPARVGASQVDARRAAPATRADQPALVPDCGSQHAACLCTSVGVQ